MKFTVQYLCNAKVRSCGYLIYKYIDDRCTMVAIAHYSLLIKHPDFLLERCKTSTLSRLIIIII